MKADNRFEGTCPTCGQSYLGESHAALVRALETAAEWLVNEASGPWVNDPAEVLKEIRDVLDKVRGPK